MMNFAESARNTDAIRARALTVALLHSAIDTSDENFADIEVNRANELPLIKGFSDGIDEVLEDRLRELSFSKKKIEAVRIGIDIAKVFMSAYVASEEIPNSMPAE